MRHVARQLSTRVPSGGTRHTQILYPAGRCSLLSGYVVRTLGRKTRAILSHFRQPITARIPSPAERKDRDDGKSSPTISDSRLQSDDDSATVSVPSWQAKKVFPPLKGDRASDTIKGPSCEEGGKRSDSGKRRADWSSEQWLTKPSEGVSEHPVRTSFAGWLRQESSLVERERPSGAREDPGDTRHQQNPFANCQSPTL